MLFRSKTMTSPSRATISSSPYLQRQLRSMISIPPSTRCSAAKASPRAPNFEFDTVSPCGHRIAEWPTDVPTMPQDVIAPVAKSRSQIALWTNALPVDNPTAAPPRRRAMSVPPASAGPSFGRICATKYAPAESGRGIFRWNEPNGSASVCGPPQCAASYADCTSWLIRPRALTS